jgi:hypothetical protein
MLDGLAKSEKIKFKNLPPLSHFSRLNQYFICAMKKTKIGAD